MCELQGMTFKRPRQRELRDRHSTGCEVAEACSSHVFDCGRYNTRDTAVVNSSSTGIFAV